MCANQFKRELSVFEKLTGALCEVIGGEKLKKKMGEQESMPPLSSMDCWDYTIELECLQGNQGNVSI